MFSPMNISPNQIDYPVGRSWHSFPFQPGGKALKDLIAKLLDPSSSTLIWLTKKQNKIDIEHRSSSPLCW